MSMRTPKAEVQILVYTATHRIAGTYFKVPDARLLDDLNARKDFFPLTHVKISSLTDESRAVLETDFLAVNRHQIAFVSTHAEHG